MVDEDVQICWTEQGGPDVPTELTGYGSSLVRRTVEDQLGRFGHETGRKAEQS